MERIKKTIEVDCPLTHVYNQWTQFEEFPRFMEGVKEVRQLDDQRLHWRADIGGKEKEWTAKIVEQIPDNRIAWRSESGEYTSGLVDFARLGTDRTRVALEISYDPKGFIENVGDAVGLVSSYQRFSLRYRKPSQNSRIHFQRNLHFSTKAISRHMRFAVPGS